MSPDLTVSGSPEPLTAGRLSRRDFLTASALAGAGLWITACGGTSSSGPATSAAPKTTTKVTMIESGSGAMGWAPNYVAIEAGYFKEEGLEVDYQYAAVQAAVAAAVSGSSFMSFSGASVALTAIAKGAPIRVVNVESGQYTAELAATPAFLNSRSVSATSPLADRVKALKNAKVGIFQPGDSTDQMLRFLLKQHSSLNPNTDLMIVSLKDQPSMLAALQRASVDVIVASPPTPEQAQSQGTAKIYIKPQEVPQLSGFPYLIGIANQSDIQSRLSLVTGAVRAIARGVELLRKDPKTAQPMVRTHLPSFAADVFDLSYQAMLTMLPKSPVLSKAQFSVFTSFNEQLGTPFTTPYEQAIEIRPAQQAAKDLKL
jgi:ABC-type nitrate/sulfonate/bicarbonate transport system substrate-binding protein